MKTSWRCKPLLTGLAVCALLGPTMLARNGHGQAVKDSSSNPGSVLESSRDTRFQLDLHVPDAALKALLPSGFTSSVATQGPAKDANLRLIFTDRITVKGPDGKRLGTGTGQLVELVAPVKDADGHEAQLIVGGLCGDPACAPGAFGAYQLATTHTMSRAVSNQTGTNQSGPLVESEDWVFRAASGERVEMHIKFERGFGFGLPLAGTRYYSAAKPGFYQLWQQDQQLDILRNLTITPPDRVREFSLKAGGGSFGKLFDGTEKVLSWDNIPWLNRTVLAGSN